MARFANAAARLAGLAGAVLGWRPDEFWRATPEELAGVLDALMQCGADGGGGAFGAAMPPPDAADIARLMEQYPDER